MDSDDDSLFGSAKSIMGLFCITGISLYFIYWFYTNIMKDNSTQNNITKSHRQLNQNQRNQNITTNSLNNLANRPVQSNVSLKKKSSSIKEKLSINMSLFMLDDETPSFMDINYLYEIFDYLSEFYSLYLIIKIKCEDNDAKKMDKIKEDVLKFLSPIITDNIVYEHRIIFCSSNEGYIAIIRSLDPFIHIENESNVVIQLIRYINEFWFVKKKSEKIEIEKKIKADQNNLNLNSHELMDKIKFYLDFQQLIKKEIIDNKWNHF